MQEGIVCPCIAAGRAVAWLLAVNSGQSQRFWSVQRGKSSESSRANRRRMWQGDSRRRLPNALEGPERAETGGAHRIRAVLAALRLVTSCQICLFPRCPLSVSGASLSPRKCPDHDVSHFNRSLIPSHNIVRGTQSFSSSVLSGGGWVRRCRQYGARRAG